MPSPLLPWVPLLGLLRLASPGEEVPAPAGAVPTGSSSGAGAAASAVLPLSARATVRSFSWGFETVDASGRELYGMVEVPIHLGGRLTQPDWTQEFGARASPLESDRYPRDPLAVLSGQEPRSGARSLLLRSRGDHSLVHLQRPIPVSGGIGLRLQAQARTRGFQEGGLTLSVRFTGDGLPAALQSIQIPLARCEEGWRLLELEGQVPELAASLDIEIRTEGSYRDGPAEAWVDDVRLDLRPGLRLDWGSRRLLLFGPEDRDAVFVLEARGLLAGVYRVEATLERLELASGPAPPPAFVFGANRYVPPHPGGEAAPLRFRGNLRTMFPGVSSATGIHLLGCRVRGPILTRDETGPVLSEMTQRIGFIDGAGGRASGRGLRIGWAVGGEEILAGDLDLVAQLPSSFPLHELLWEPRTIHAGGAAGTHRIPDLPPAVRLAGERTHLPWRGRLSSELIRHPEIAARLKEWAPLIRYWSLDPREAQGAAPESPRELAPALAREAAPETALAAESLSGLIRSLVQAAPLVTFGSGMPGARPPWAAFRERRFPAGSDSAASAPGAGSDTVGSELPDAGDWTLVSMGPQESEEISAREISSHLLELAAAGHRRIFLERFAERCFSRSASGPRAPRLAWVAWQKLGRLLASSGPPLDRSSWDPRARLCFLDGGGEKVLVALSRDGDPFPIRRWTGGPLEGEDLLGSPVSVPFDPKTQESEIEVTGLPTFYRGLDLELVETVESLAPEGPGLEPRAEWQESRFRLQNRTAGGLEVEAELQLPEGFRAGPGPIRASGAAGEGIALNFPVLTPEGASAGRINARFILRLRRDGQRAGQQPGPRSGEGFREISLAREIEIRSRWIRLSGASLDARGRILSFTIESLSPRPLTLQVDARVPRGEGRDLLESWEARLPPSGKRELSFSLDAPPGELAGREVWIAAEILGQAGALRERFHLRLEGDHLILGRKP